MSQLTAMLDLATTSTTQVSSAQTDQLDLLIDRITGTGREALEGLSVAHIYNALAAQIAEMGLRPAEQKLLRIAHWIAASPAV